MYDLYTATTLLRIRLMYDGLYTYIGIYSLYLYCHYWS